MILQLIVAVVGILMYALCTNPKLSEVGRIMFWTGILSFLLGSATVVAGFLHH